LATKIQEPNGEICLFFKEILATRKLKNHIFLAILNQKNQLAKFRPKSTISHVFWDCGIFVFLLFPGVGVKPIASSCFCFLPILHQEGIYLIG
jgi:hypothetical protein